MPIQILMPCDLDIRPFDLCVPSFQCYAICPTVEVMTFLNRGSKFSTSTTYNAFQATSKQDRMKKALGETKTLRAGCSKAEPKIFAPPQTPSRGCGMAKI